jgi:hypothetical protein
MIAFLGGRMMGTCRKARSNLTLTGFKLTKRAARNILLYLGDKNQPGI